MDKPTRRVASVLNELELEEFESLPTKKRRRSAETVFEQQARRCRHCMQLIRVKDDLGFVKHKGPCGRPCLGGGVKIGQLFHCDRCSDLECVRLHIPIPGVPRRQ